MYMCAHLFTQMYVFMCVFMYVCMYVCMRRRRSIRIGNSRARMMIFRRHLPTRLRCMSVICPSTQLRRNSMKSSAKWASRSASSWGWTSFDAHHAASASLCTIRERCVSMCEHSSVFEHEERTCVCAYTHTNHTFAAPLHCMEHLHTRARVYVCV